MAGTAAQVGFVLASLPRCLYPTSPHRTCPPGQSHQPPQPCHPSPAESAARQTLEPSEEAGGRVGREVRDTVFFPSIPLLSCSPAVGEGCSAPWSSASQPCFWGPGRRSENKTPPYTPTFTSMGGNLLDPCHTRSFPVTPISLRERLWLTPQRTSNRRQTLPTLGLCPCPSRLSSPFPVAGGSRE